MRRYLSILIPLSVNVLSKEVESSYAPVLTCLSDIGPKIAEKCSICNMLLDFKSYYYNYEKESPSVIEEFKNIEERERKLKKYLVCSNTNCGIVCHALCMLNTNTLMIFQRTGIIYFDCECCNQTVTVFDSNTFKYSIERYLTDSSPLALTNLLYYLRISNSNLSNMMLSYPDKYHELVLKVENENNFSVLRLLCELQAGFVCSKNSSKFSDILKALRELMSFADEFTYPIVIKELKKLKDYQAEDYQVLKSSVFEMLEKVTDDVYELYSPVFTVVLKQCISLISKRKDRIDFISEFLLSKYSYLLCSDDNVIFYFPMMPDFNAVLHIFHKKLLDPKCYESILKNNSLAITTKFLSTWSKVFHHNSNWLILYMFKSIFKNEMAYTILNIHMDPNGHKIVLYKLFFSGDSKEVSKNPKNYCGIMYALALKCYFQHEYKTSASQFMSFLVAASFYEKKYKPVPQAHLLLAHLHNSLDKTESYSYIEDRMFKELGLEALCYYFNTKQLEQHVLLSKLPLESLECVSSKSRLPYRQERQIKILSTLNKQPILFTRFKEKNVIEVFNMICAHEGPHKTGSLVFSIRSFDVLENAFEHGNKHSNISCTQANVSAWCEEINFIGFEKLLETIYYFEKKRCCFISLYYSHIIQYLDNVQKGDFLEKTIQRNIALVALIATSDTKRVKIADIFNALLSTKHNYININNWFCNLACAQKMTILDYIIKELAKKNNINGIMLDDFKLAFLNYYIKQKELFPDYSMKFKPKN
ncbi:hypothetical protein ENBRE01_2312 [Enteropsectra breve]|nr:hypothetical protein ENBRE01_2312 [Enteropsectra breve]